MESISDLSSEGRKAVKSVVKQFTNASCCPVTSGGSGDVTMTQPPGPGGPPFIGQAFSIDSSHLHLQFMEWQKQYGDLVMFRMMGKHYLVISHPDIVRQMFITCPHAHMLNDRPASFMGSHVIGKTQDILFRRCDDLQRAMKLAVWTFVEKTVFEQDWYHGGLASEMELTAKSIVSQRSSGHQLDMPKILDQTASKLVALMLLGRQVDDSEPAFKSLEGFTNTGNQLATVKNQTILTVIPCARKLPGQLKRTVNTIMTEKENLKRYFIEENKSEYGLVRNLLNLKASKLESNESSDWLNDDFILGTIMDMTAAAIVPLMNSLSVLFLVLAHYPEVQETFRKEVQTVMRKTGKLPTVHDKQDMPYAHACILELKRFHSPLAISARHSNRGGDAAFEQYRIPKDTEIFTNLFGMNHDERFWENPWEFKPERFQGEDGLLLPEDHETMRNLIANGVGPRACVGVVFADSNMIVITSALLAQFSIQPSEGSDFPGCDPRKFKPGVVLRAPDYTCKVVDIET